MQQQQLDSLETQAAHLEAFLDGTLDPSVDASSLFRVDLLAADEVALDPERRRSFMDGDSREPSAVEPEPSSVEARIDAARARVDAYVSDTQYEKDFETDVNLRVMRAFEKRGIQPPAILVRNQSGENSLPRPVSVGVA